MEVVEGMMWTILGICCEMIGGHWLKPWEPMPTPWNHYLSFEHAQCKVCRQWYIRPRPLGEMFGQGLRDWHP